jgi:hypothetical protein
MLRAGLLSGTVGRIATHGPTETAAMLHARGARQRLPWIQYCPHQVDKRNIAAMGLTKVYESLHLVEFEEECPLDIVSNVVDSIWSLQYVVPGPICGFAGPLQRSSIGSSGTHFQAVLFRYGDQNKLNTFLAAPKTQDLFQTATHADNGGAAITTFSFQGAVPAELEAIFRRGSEWDTGVELIIALQLQVGG